ncbi:MAG TPA: hypothetical protein VFM88_20075 [Vicinamibacteria bacterium]|nr:hypothetical protein [Vicinamibacteria bacterium]
MGLAPPALGFGAAGPKVTAQVVGLGMQTARVAAEDSQTSIQQRDRDQKRLRDASCRNSPTCDRTRQRDRDRAADRDHARTRGRGRR